MALTRRQKNELFGIPGAAAVVDVSSRLPWTPRTQAEKVQVVLAHVLIADEFVAACHAAAAGSTWVPQRIDSLSVRSIRGKEDGWTPGGPNTSNHAWALAFDFFATPADLYPPGGVWTPHNGVPEEFARAFTDRGWRWGGNWGKPVDTPHIEYAGRPAARSQEDLVDWLTGMLKLGDYGADTVDLQGALGLLGVDVPITGIYDPATKAAVEGVQRLAGLTVDGLFGPKTENAVFVMLKESDPGQVVDRGYRMALGRPADAEASAYWVGQLAVGWDPIRFWRHLLVSKERTAPPPPVPVPVASGPITDVEVRHVLFAIAAEIGKLSR